MRQPDSIEQDRLEERAAIMAEGNGWTQEKAERHLYLEAGCVSWGQLMDKSRSGGEAEP
jgi:hypothetical protein